MVSDAEGEVPGRGAGPRRIALRREAIRPIEVARIAIRGGETFRSNGGQEYAALPCLNDSPAGMRVIEAVVRRELSGWVPAP